MINLRAIHFRLILWYGSLVVVVLLAFGAYVYRGVQARLYADMERTLNRRATQIGTSILPRFGATPGDALAREIETVYSPEVSGRFIRVVTADGTRIYQSGPPADGAFDPDRIPSPIGPDAHLVPINRAGGMLIVSITATAASGPVIIEMGGLTTDIDRVLARLITTLLIGLPFIILAISAGGYWLVRRSLRPVEELRATAQKLTFGSSDSSGPRRLPVAATGDDIEQLGVTLNKMLERLHDAYQQASRFSADASHELRTPLAIIRGELESLLLRNEPLPKTARDQISNVLEEAERLSYITESLFSLSRLDAGEAKRQDVPVDLAELVRGTVDQMRLMAEEKRIDLMLQTNEPVVTHGDPARIKQIIIGLLDNAIKYTPEGGQVTLKVYAERRHAVFKISDSGIGIAAEALPHVFDRFYRADKARSRQVDGAGLGLSIVKSICSAHGGAVDISSIEGRGTVCRVALPLAA
jgi:heavy metal sensor kinase